MIALNWLKSCEGVDPEAFGSSRHLTTFLSTEIAYLFHGVL